MSGAQFLMQATELAMGLLGLALLLTVYRILRGPTLPDRVLALDTITLLGLGFIAVVALRSGRMVYLDLAIALGLVGFLVTIALAAFIMRRTPRAEFREGGGR